MSENILIVTGGMTPQVVSETVFALARRAPEPFVPSRIVCVVTATAAPRFERDLPAVLERLAQDWDISQAWRLEVQFPTHEDGTPIDDIRSDGDAVRFGDLVADIVRQATADDGTRVHVSLAGGRKSMSFHGGAAITLFGRPWDELSHVLVHPEHMELECTPGMRQENEGQFSEGENRCPRKEDSIAVSSSSWRLAGCRRARM